MVNYKQLQFQDAQLHARVASSPRARNLCDSENHLWVNQSFIFNAVHQPKKPDMHVELHLASTTPESSLTKEVRHKLPKPLLQTPKFNDTSDCTLSHQRKSWQWTEIAECAVFAFRRVRITEPFICRDRCAIVKP